MKFPKSVHAEGWDQQVYGSGNQIKTNNPALSLKRGFKAGAKPVSLHTPLHGDAPAASASFTTPVRPAVTAPAARPPVVTANVAAAGPLHAAARPAAGTPTSATPPRGSSLPWVVGAGVGVLLIGGAVVMSRSMPPSTPAVQEPSTPVVVGQVTPSPEDAQLQAAPPSAGTTAPIATLADAAPATPVDTPAAHATADEATAVKAAPAETRSAKATAAPATSGLPVWAATPAPRAEAPAPVVRTLTPPAEALAQASPPPVLRPAPVMAPPPVLASVSPQVAAPVTPPPAPAEAASAAVPPTAMPASPPVVAQQAPAPAPATPDPADTGITVQVRQALASDATLAAVPIAVSTDHGVVKLEGQAPDAQARDRATVVAANTVGVKAVDNRLTLPPVASLDRGPASSGG